MLTRRCVCAKAEELGWDHPGVQYMAASLWKNASKWDKTVSAFRRAAALRQDVGSLRGLTLALVAHGQLRAALQAASKLQRLAPKSPHSHCVMGQVLAESENCADKAERALRTALAMDPAEETAASALAKLQTKAGSLSLAAETCAAEALAGEGRGGRVGWRSHRATPLQATDGATVAAGRRPPVPAGPGAATDGGCAGRYDRLPHRAQVRCPARHALRSRSPHLPPPPPPRSLRPGIPAASDGLKELEDEARGLAHTESRAGHGDVEVVGD